LTLYAAERVDWKICSAHQGRESDRTELSVSRRTAARKDGRGEGGVKAGGFGGVERPRGVGGPGQDPIGPARAQARAAVDQTLRQMHPVCADGCGQAFVRANQQD